MTPLCQGCGELIRGPRLVAGGRWLCPDCAYEAEYGSAERVEPTPRKNAMYPQKEHLFPLPPPQRRLRP
jgi:hypothetical protein